MEITKKLIEQAKKDIIKSVEDGRMRINSQRLLFKLLTQAMNYIPCCKSDSELLKDKKVINFDLWCKIKNIHHSFDDFYLWDKTLIEKKYVLKMYQTFTQNL